MKNKVIFFISICLIFIIIGIFSIIFSNNDEPNKDLLNNNKFIDQIDTYEDFEWTEVEIKGNIKVPGIYKIPDDTNIIQLICYANGFKKINIDFIFNILKYIKVNKNKVIILYKE